MLEKLRQEGLRTTLQQVRGKLSEPMPLGYSSAGVVVACGDGVQGSGRAIAWLTTGPMLRW